jgi:hypothetical protein
VANVPTAGNVDGLVTIGADLTALARQLAALPQMASEPAEKAIAAIQRQVAGAQRAITQAAREALAGQREAARAAERAAKEAATAAEKLKDIAASADPVAAATRAFERQRAEIERLTKATGDAAAGKAALSAAEKRHAADLAEIEAAASRAAGAQMGAAKASGSLARALGSVGQQLPDVIGGLAMGQAPLTILTQQGPQVAEGLLASGVSASALASALAPLAAAATVAAVAAGALYVAWKTANAEEQRAEQIARITNDAYRAMAPILAETHDLTRQLAVATGSLTAEQATLQQAAERAHRAYRDAAQQTATTLARLRAEQASVGTQVADGLRASLELFRELTGIEDGTIAVFDALVDSTATLTPQIEAATAAQRRQIEATGENADKGKELAAALARQRAEQQGLTSARQRAGEVEALLATLRRAELASLSAAARALAEARADYTAAAAAAQRLGLSAAQSAAGLSALSAAVRDASTAAALADLEPLFEPLPRQISRGERAAADLSATLDTLIPPAALTSTERLAVAQASLAVELSRGSLSATAAAEAQARLAAAQAALAEPWLAVGRQIDSATDAAVTAAQGGAEEVAAAYSAIPWARVLGDAIVGQIRRGVAAAQQVTALLTGGALGGGLAAAANAISGAAQEGAQASAAASERIAQARRAIAQADTAEERAAAQADLKRAEAEKRRAEAMVADPGGAAARAMAKQALSFVEALARGVGPFVVALARRADEIAYAIAKAMPVVVEALVRGGPQIAWAIVRGLAEAWADLARRLARIVRDAIGEAVTGGRRETRTFGDTPGPVHVTRPTTATFSPGDYVIAARSRDGLQQQAQAPAAQARSAPDLDPEALAAALSRRTLAVRVVGGQRHAGASTGRGPVYR